jgi:hypothetical protein
LSGDGDATMSLRSQRSNHTPVVGGSSPLGRLQVSPEHRERVTGARADEKITDGIHTHISEEEVEKAAGLFDPLTAIK